MSVLIKYGWVGLIAILLSGCAGKKALRKDNSGMVMTSVEDARQLLEDADIPFTWFAGQGQGRLDWEDQRVTVRLKVRMYRDSVIWIQIQKLGFEVGRMLVRPDSSFLINRLEKYYSLYSTPDFFAEYNLLPDFNMFCKAFTGGAYIPRGNNVIKKQDAGIMLHAEDGSHIVYAFNDKGQLMKAEAVDKWHRSWNSGYGDYRNIADGLFMPFIRKNELILDGETHLLDLMYDEIILDVPQEMPFSIPSHYEKL